jgi:hypothetical protein
MSQRNPYGRIRYKFYYCQPQVKLSPIAPLTSGVEDFKIYDHFIPFFRIQQM